MQNSITVDQGHPYEHGFDPRLAPDKLREPLRWSGSRTVFVNSMSDLFQDAVPDNYVATVAEVMLRAEWHTYPPPRRNPGACRSSAPHLVGRQC